MPPTTPCTARGAAVRADKSARTWPHNFQTEAAGARQANPESVNAIPTAVPDDAKETSLAELTCMP